jgi:hypothetical protein
MPPLNDSKKDKKSSNKKKSSKKDPGPPIEAQPPPGPLVALGKPRDKAIKRPRSVGSQLAKSFIYEFSLSLSLWYFGLVYMYMYMFLLISMLLDLLVARIGCGVWGGGRMMKFRGGYMECPLMIMTTYEYHEQMHAAYMHVHAHVGPCMHAPTYTHDIHAYRDDKQIIINIQSCSFIKPYTTDYHITIIVSLTCVPWSLLWLRITLLGNHYIHVTLIVVHAHAATCTSTTYTL